MNPAYRHARFRVGELPGGGLPERFSIVTACNPHGRTHPEAENALRTETLRQHLVDENLDHFSVTGYDLQSPHAEPGFGIVCEPSVALALGRVWEQEAIFNVHQGEVSLVPCFDPRAEIISIGRWEDLADRPEVARPPFHFRGRSQLLSLPSTAFLCSTRCPGDKILAAYDWARVQCDAGAAVISGFHTPVEKDVLAILARRGAKILWVPARDLPKRIPTELQPAFEEGRLVLLTPFDPGKPSRPTRESCSIRNRFVLAWTTNRFIPHVAEGSSAAVDLASLEI